MRCIDCGRPATVIDLDAYGKYGADSYCDVCFISNHAPSAPIHTAVYGHDAEVMTLTEHARCSNCDILITAIDAIVDPGVLGENEYGTGRLEYGATVRSGT